MEAALTQQERLQMVSEWEKALRDNLDHPEFWSGIQKFAATEKHALTEVADAIEGLLALPQQEQVQTSLGILLGILRLHTGQPEVGQQILEDLFTRHSQHITVGGALFHARKLKEPDNPKYQLEGKYCLRPFERLEVLEGTTTNCCAAFFKAHLGNMHLTPWQDIWNGPVAQSVRKTIHDGTYRYCNKMLCPSIQQDALDRPGDYTDGSAEQRLVEQKATVMDTGPLDINLAYDRTCNLSCPSCRTERYAAGEEERARFSRLQDNNIIPMLKGAKRVLLTGSGDPFASKNFRQLLQRLNREEFPDLNVKLLTNAMLLSPKEWAKFPDLPDMVNSIQISIDAATAETHELLRRGARWDTMLENMQFIGELRRQGILEDYSIFYVVQTENFREMGDAVDIAKDVGADVIRFLMINNWNTFTPEEFAAKCVFKETHSLYEEFLKAMADPRMSDPIVTLSNLEEFRQVPAKRSESRIPANRRLPVVA